MYDQKVQIDSEMGKKLWLEDHGWLSTIWTVNMVHLEAFKSSIIFEEDTKIYNSI